MTGTTRCFGRSPSAARRVFSPSCEGAERMFSPHRARARRKSGLFPGVFRVAPDLDLLTTDETRIEHEWRFGRGVLTALPRVEGQGCRAYDGRHGEQEATGTWSGGP
jgi:hypothetical protein